MHDPEAAVGQLWDRLIAVAKGLSDDDWHAPTSPDGWNVQAVLEHCADLQSQLDGGAWSASPDEWVDADEQPGGVWGDGDGPADAQRSPEEVRTALRTAREGHVARLQRVADWGDGVEGAAGRTTEAELLAARCYDLWVRLQDLHAALGKPYDIGDDSEAALLAHHYVLERVPWLFAERAGVEDGASMRLVLAAPMPFEGVVVALDGKGHLTTPASDAASTLRASPEALTLLVSGRGSVQQWHALGLMEVRGAPAERFAEHGRLA